MGTGRDIGIYFIDFETEIEDGDLDEGGYCAIGKENFLKKYLNLHNESYRLGEFLEFYFDPAKHLGDRTGYISLLRQLNEYLKFDNLVLKLNGNNTKIHMESTDQETDPYSKSYTNGKEIKKIILKNIEEASKCIYMNMYRINDEDIIEALIYASDRNIDVQVILDNSSENNDFIKEYRIEFPIYFAKGWKEMRANNHHKYYIIDNRFLLHGTANATFSAFNNNNEDLSTTGNLLQIKTYREQFIKIRKECIDKT